MSDEWGGGLEATVDRWEGDLVVLRTADGQELLWPAEQLPPEVTEGDVLRLTLSTAGEAAQQQRELAREILNEILDTGDGVPED